MITRKTWKEFQQSGLLFLINQLLHFFGWAIVMELDNNGEIIEAYPSRVKFRGFDGKSVDTGYTKVTKYLKENIDELLNECEPLEEES